MKKARFATLVSAGLALGLLALGGCSSPASTPTDAGPESKGEIGFFVASTQISVAKTLADSITTFFEAEGYTVSVVDAGFDPVKQAQQIQQAIDTHSIAGAWIFPVAPEATAESIGALQAAGIPTVIEGPPIAFGFTDAQAGLAFDAPDFVKYGATIGELAGGCATENAGHEALFLTPPDTTGGTSAVVDAIKGAYESSAPDVKIVDTAQAGDIAQSQTAVAQLLIAHPDADVVIATTDETALGALGAYRAAGKTPLCIVAGGGAPDTIAAQEGGDITAVVAWDYSSAVTELGADLLRLIDSPSSEGKVVETALTITE
jgi:ribose transport system substrate-binding protein